MRYSFRLAELLGHMPDPSRRPGTIKTIVEHTGLDRHQVANLLRNEVKYLPIHALSRICDYLIEKGHCRAEELPGALFAVEPEHFWELLARRSRLDLSVGVRWPERDSPEGALVVASDSVLLGEVLNGLSASATFSDGESAAPPHLRQMLVWSPSSQLGAEVVEARARKVFDQYEEAAGDKALICLGSIKSNPVVELVLSMAFRCGAFKSQDDVARPADRSCPFFLRYRDNDPHHPSSSGGTRLARSEPAERPGFYYETPGGEWAHLGWDVPQHDVALVFYVHHESQGRLEMVLGGFSGRATRLLARTLATRAEEFWPPVFRGKGVQIGAFIVQYTLDTKTDHAEDLLRTDLVANTRVIRIHSEVIQRRFQ